MKTNQLIVIFKLLWKNYIYDIAHNYVEKTDNKYDDYALKQLNAFILNLD